MSDYIGNIAVSEIAPSGTFPIVPDYGYGRASAPEVVIHQFGSGNAKIEQRYLLGTGAKRFTVRRAFLRDSDRTALCNFWETSYGPYGAFTYNAPNDDGNGTTPYVCRFANEPLSWEMVADWACSLGVTLIEIPSSSPTYTLNQTANRFPPTALQTALLSQVQEIIPLVRIQPLESGYPAIYVSDRRCTVGGQLYQARLLEFDGISQSIGNEADEAQFTFGNADRVMRALANDVDLYRAAISLSLFHVGTGIKLDLWKGDLVNWSCDAGPEFKVTAADGLYELNLPYPTRKISRTCWKQFKGPACPYVGSDTSCDKGFDTPNGCRTHGMDNYFGGIVAQPQGVRIKDNSTGTWGFGRSPITSVSLVADSIYDQVLPEIYTDSPMPVNCKIAAGREESEFYDALGIVGAGPLGSYGSGHLLDNQPNHGPGDLGLRTSLGNDPNPDSFSLGEGTPQVWGPERAAGTAFIKIRRTDAKGFQPSRLTEHQMQAVVSVGMSGWMWSAPGVRTWGALINPIWIAVNMLLRARGLQFADAATCEQYFDVDSAITMASAICDQQVTKLVGTGTETQFKFRGVLQEEKPLRDWLQEVLMNCLGYYTFANGKLKLGIRINSSSVEAFTEGNILFRSLELATLKPSFNHLTANFADEDFDFVANSISLYDIDHAALLGGGAGPLFLKSTVNLSGTASKSQAARIITVRLREELGGITPAEWKAARQISFKTTALALNTEPGMVCSMTHPDMPGGSGEFRVTSWRLNKDYSIDIQGRTTTDSMYDLAIGPKPADVVAEPVPGEPYFESAPNVVMFKAGKSNGDGTFDSTMYWDSRRQMMLIDWACMLPSDTSNWGGVQIWIKSPDGSGFKYAKATDTIDSTMFDQSGDARFHYDTIAIAPESVPDPPETWSIIAVSLNRFGTPNTDVNGNPAGVAVDLQTLAKSDYVSGFSASVVIETTESGDQMFRLVGSWTNAPIPRYKGVRIIMRGWGAQDIPLADEGEGATTFRTDAWPLPEATKVVQIYATPIFGDGTVAAIVPGTTPMAEVTISRLGGTTGKEYCEVVTGFSAVVATPAYAVNADGQKVLRVNLSWTNPADVRFGGVVIFVDWYDGNTFQLTGLERGTSLKWETSYFPSTASSVTFYALSVDTNNRRNTYQAGITPSSTVVLPSPQLGPAGSEYTSNVTGFSVSVSYPATADGTYVALITSSFTPPSDPTWGGVELRVSEDGGYTFTTRASTQKSPVTFELSAKAFAQTYSVYAVSFDVNNRANIPLWSVTPHQDIIVGSAAGQLDLRKFLGASVAATFANVGGVFDISPSGVTEIKINTGAITETKIANNSISTPKIQALAITSDLIAANAVIAGKIAANAVAANEISAGSVSSAKLDATVINVGGGGGKPGKFAVYNASGQQIGFIGVESGYEGAWFKQFRVGGTSAADAKLIADSSGNVSIGGATFTLATNGITTKIDNGSPDGWPAGLQVYDASSNRVNIGISGYAPQIYMRSNGSGSSISLRCLGSGNGGAITLSDVSGTSGIELFGDYYGSGYWRGHITAGGANFVRELKVNSIQAIDSSSAFVGHGVSCPSYGVGGAGFNTYYSGAWRYGATESVPYLKPDQSTGYLWFYGGVYTGKT